jgi:DSF synthase
MQVPVHQFPPVFESLKQLKVRFDSSHKVLWTFLDPDGRTCFNESLLENLKHCYGNIEDYGRAHLSKSGSCPILYTVLASKHPNVFSYGGDIFLFKRMISDQDREGLRKYAQLCIDNVYIQSVNYNLPMTTISLVQGDALGGGFEAAICCSVMIAEKRARFGLPEILFNLFPGMGAYHFLARRVGMKRVEEIMTSGNVYTAEEMHAMGVVDVLSEDGGGEKAVYEFIRNHSRRNKARQGIAKVRHGVFRVAKEELERAADIWVDTALSLDDTDLRIMERLVRAQMAKENGGPQLRADGGSGS